VLEKPAAAIAVEAVAGGIPEKLSLLQNYPNPFNPTTAIRYGLPEDSHVRIKILTTLGQEIATVADDDEPAGIHEIVWDGTAAASGIYFVRLEGIPLAARGRAVVQTMKIVLMK
jgi:hypothetical protein